MTTNETLNVPYSRCEFKKVGAIEFGILSPDALNKMSVVKIDQAELYDKDKPKVGGLMDLRMGTMNMRLACETCKLSGKDTKHCPGHFGSIELAEPMYHISFLTNVMKILKCVCHGCSRLLCRDNPKMAQVLKYRPRDRFRAVYELCNKGSARRCASDNPASGDTGCGCLQPKYERDLTAAAILVTPAVDKDEDEEGGSSGAPVARYFHADEAHKILKRITLDDCRAMGFDPERAHPAWMIVTVLPVPPPAVRPSVQFGGQSSEDDLTVHLMGLLRVNETIKKQRQAGASKHLLEEYKKTLQFNVFSVVTNGIPGLPVATTRLSKKPIKSITQRLKGKEGRLRGNLMGKRVDFSARTVITGDPSLMIDQVGVPRSVAMTLTFPERVTALNKEKLLQLVRNGPHVYPGARYVVREDGNRYDLRYADPEKVDLGIGWVVERHMQDDDFVLFNRQPSLHKMSIMGHRAKILPFSTFRLNLSVTSPYNADFDGDEMNLHLAQSHETRAEIRHLMMNPKQIVSPQGNEPVMGIVQDTLLGIAKMTSKNTFLRKDEMMNALMWLPAWDGRMPEPSILKPEKLWTGKQLITLLLQDMKISMERKNKLFSDACPENKYCKYNDSWVVLREGELICGVIDKSCVGAAHGSAVHLIWLEHGPEKTKNFLSWTQTLVNHWLLHNGFSVGCADIIANTRTVERVDEIMAKSKADVKSLVIQAQKGTLETQAGKSMFQSFEEKVNKILNDARASSGNAATESFDDRNNIVAMVLAGSKGSNLNISQIIACVGQQNVEGKRIPFGFEQRTLPHFTKDDYGPESRGFVENSYLAGLTPQEFFFHAMGGREGVIDTACKTAETGYIQRRLIKALEDARVHYDRTVRTGNGEVLQFLYGEDGMAGEFIEKQALALVSMSADKVAKEFRHSFGDAVADKAWISDVHKNQILSSPELAAVLEDEYQRLLEAKKLLCQEVFVNGDSHQHLPINMARILQSVKDRVGEEDPRDLSPVDVVDRVEKTLKRLVIAKGTDSTSVEVQANATKLLNAHLRASLNSKVLLKQLRLGPDGLDWVLGEVEKQFYRSLAAAGEVVGTIAAQSVGQPATQMTLNTFHHAGIGTKNVTLGVPRLKEIINIARTLKTPSLTVYLDSQYRGSMESAKLVQSRLEYTMMERITAFTQILYDPVVTTSSVGTDASFVEDFYELGLDSTDPSKLSPWVLRMELRDKVMADKAVEMREVEKALLEFWGANRVQVIVSDQNADHLVVRLRLIRHDLGSDGDEATNREYEHVLLAQMENRMLNELSLRGVPGIRKVFMRSTKNDSSRVYVPSQGKFEKVDEWVLDTDGVNLRGVLHQEGVDAVRTTSNDITEVLDVLGIEAARRALLKELRAVLSFDGSYVNYRHLALLCDAMTFRGSFMAITRHGLNRGERGPLAKASFEETVDILMEAAAFADTDKLKGVSEPIIMGQLCHFGTGSFDVLIDDEKLGAAQSQNVVAGTAQLNDLSSDADSRWGSSSGYSPDMVGSSAGHTSHMDTPFSPVNVLSPIQQQQHYAASHILSGRPQSVSMDFAPLSPFVEQQQAQQALKQQFGGRMVMPSSVGMQHRVQQSYTATSPFAASPVMSPAAFAAAQSPSYNNQAGNRRTGGGGLSPGFSPTSPHAQATSPHYSPTSPHYSPTSPNVAATSPMMSPYSPAFSPTSPQQQENYRRKQAGAVISPGYSPTSPGFRPTSPHASPTSPLHSPTSPVQKSRQVQRQLNAMSPAYSPTSPQYSPASPKYN